jgi:hypothetical protein
MREALNADQEGGSAVALPPDATIKADLAAPRWHLTPRGILIEDKLQTPKRPGRSPDDGDAIVMALSEGDRRAAREPGLCAFEAADSEQELLHCAEKRALQPVS